MKKFSRRDTLKLLCSLPAILSVNVKANTSNAKDDDLIENRINTYCRSLSSELDTEKLGILYRKKYAYNSDKKSLIHAISKNLLNSSQNKYLNSTHFDTIVKNTIKNDFEFKDIVVLDGWWLSHTEARIFALSTYVV